MGSDANYVALLGAGFSKNWGGWLASEAFEYLLGSPQIDDFLRSKLIESARKGGFEAVLAEAQRVASGKPGQIAQKLTDAILEMLREMDKAFENVSFEFGTDDTDVFRHRSISSFLNRFNAIFTLNQDLLLERYYLKDNANLHSPYQWVGSQLPGMRPTKTSGSYNPANRWTPLPEKDRSIDPKSQPYIKLHGSSNWFDESDQIIIAMGGRKQSTIVQTSILNWYSQLFETYLSKPNTRLMIIGYSFHDEHINQKIRHASTNGNIRCFIIDPLGIDVIDKNRDAQIYAPDQLAKDIWPSVIGASRRSLSEIFGRDAVEFSKLMRFFNAPP